MRATVNYALPFPESGDHTRTWEYWQALAEAVDTLLAGGFTIPRGHLNIGTGTDATQYMVTVNRSVTGVAYKLLYSISAAGALDLTLQKAGVVKAALILAEPGALSIGDGTRTRPIPYAMAVGSSAVPINNSVSGSVTVTLPANRFTTSTIVTANSSNYDYVASIAWSLATGFQLNLVSVSAFVATLSVDVHWHAIQMSPTSGPG